MFYLFMLSTRYLSLRLLAKVTVDSPTHIDDLLGCLENYSSSEIVAVLFELELLGLVRQLPGKMFLRNQ